MWHFLGILWCLSFAGMIGVTNSHLNLYMDTEETNRLLGKWKRRLLKIEILFPEHRYTHTRLDTVIFIQCGLI